MTNRLRLSLPLLAIALFCTPSFAAATTVTARGLIATGPVALVSSYQQDDQRVFVERASFTFTGSLAGSFTGTVTRTLDIDTLATTERTNGTCICTLGNRTGLITLKMSEDASGRGRMVVVRGSGALAGLLGKGTVRNSGAATRPYVLNYRFAASHARSDRAPEFDPYGSGAVPGRTA